MFGSTLSHLIAAGILLSPLAAAPPVVDAGALTIEILNAWKPALGLDQHSSFAVNAVTPDPVTHGTDVRVNQYYQGVRVMGGEAIMHLRGVHVRSFTDAFLRKFTLDPKPALTPSEALAIAVKDLAPKGPFVLPPSTELVVVRALLGPGQPAQRDALVFHIHTELENGRRETKHTDYFIDAHTGAIDKRWNSLRSEGAVGTGRSQYSGKVAINTNSTDSGFELRDLTRGDSGNTVVDLAHGTSDSGGSILTNATNTWGDGQNYAGGATTSVNGQTAGVDAAFGSQWTWDYYKNVHGRDGIDGNGTATSMRIHYDTAYDNAFWSDSCFCMTFGDGSQFKSLEAIDVMGHEMSHGVCANTAGLVYSGESGGLNEAKSDINGTMVEFYSRGGKGDVISNTGGNWTMGEQLETAQFPTPLRYLFKPSLDGRSVDEWSSSIGTLDVHLSSGPMNRAFYFMSQGASANSASNVYTANLPKGMTGIGNDKAARIWYRALVSYMTSTTDYAAARTACLSAAQDLYGGGGPEEAAVMNAFHGIKVGDPAPAPAPANTVTTTITAPAGDVTSPSGAAVAFAGTGKDSDPAAALTYAWTFGDGATATGASATHIFTNTGGTDATYMVAFTAKDPTGATGTAKVTVTVPASQPTPGTSAETLHNGGFELGTQHWEGNTEKIGPWKAMPPFEGKRSAWLLGSNHPAQESLYQFVVLPAKLTKATLTFQLQVAARAGAKALDTLTVEVINGAGSTTLATYSNLDAAPGYVARTLDLTGAPGEVVILLFRASGTGGPQTSFALDNVSLMAQ